MVKAGPPLKPGVAAAAFTSQLPLSADFDKYGVTFESSPNDDRQKDRGAFRYAVTPGYFEAIGIPLRRGRLLDSRDVAGSPPVVVINESYAMRRLPRIDPIGQRLRIGPEDGPWYTIVGVVGDVKQVALAPGSADAVYMPSTQWSSADRALSLVVRARGDAAALAPALRKAIWSVDKDPPIVRVATMDSLLAENAAIGLVGAVIASQAIVTLLFGVSRLDAATYLGVVALLAGTSAIACWIPAWRAACVDPSITLRAE